MNASSSGKFEFSCPSCLRPIKAGLKAAGKTLPCPGCGKMITVPTPEEARWDAVHEPPSEDEYAVAEPTESPRYTSPIVPGWEENHYESELDQDTYRAPTERSPNRDFEDDEKIVITERPKLPPHPMTTGIFSIFVDPRAIFWILTLSIFFAIWIGFSVLPIMMLAEILPRNIASFAGTLISSGISAVVGLGTFLFGSNCLLSILQDSAAGNRTIESWPDKTGGTFSLTGMLYVLGALIFGSVIGIAIALSLVEVNGTIILMLVNFFTFPFFLTSSMEADSPLLPISPVMFRSLFARFTTWFVFYLEAAILYTIAIGATVMIVFLIGSKLAVLATTCALVLGPLFTFLLFIYFRLLGRLVWVCDEWLRSLEPEEEDEEEEEEGEWEEGNER